MVYEAVLLFGLVAGVSYVVLASMRWSYPLDPMPRALLQAALLLVTGAYLIFCWTRTGQTLALKAWRLKVVTENDRPPRSGRATVRYLLAWHLWLPTLALSAIFELGLSATALALAGGFALFLIPAIWDPQRRLLHDRWTCTRVVRVG